MFQRSQTFILIFLGLAALLLGGCASFRTGEPVAVNVVGFDPLEGQGLEMRFLAKLRVQNPGEAPIDYEGVWIEMAVDGKRFASGVSDIRGTVPRFGEAVIAVPVSISLIGVARQAVSVLSGESRSKFAYEMRGKLVGSGFASTHFATQGEWSLPGAGVR